MPEVKEKPSLEEILPRLKLFIILIMMFPLVGMVIAVGIIWFQKPNNMGIILSALVFLMIFYIINIFYLIKHNDVAIKKKENTVN